MSFDGGEKRTLTSEQFREMGRDYLNKLVNDYPEQSIREAGAGRAALLDGTESQ